MRAVQLRRFTSLLAISAAAVAIGCGGDDDVNNNAGDYDGTDAEVATLVDEFGEAGRDGDGDKICEEIFTEELAGNVEEAAEQSCPSEVQENLPEGDYEVTIDSLEVDGDTATVSVSDQDDNESVLHVEKIDDDWRVARVTPAE
jgi:hypothetical protein